MPERPRPALLPGIDVSSCGTLLVFVQSGLVHIDAKTRARGKCGKSILDRFDRLRYQVGPHAAVAVVDRRGNVLDEEVGQTGSQVQRSCSGDWTAIVVWGNSDIVRFGQGPNLTNTGNACQMQIGPKDIYDA